MSAVKVSMRVLFSFLFICFSLLACTKEEFAKKTFIVADHKGDFITWTGQPVKSLLVKENENESFRALGQDIEGFSYEQGFQYLIEVKEYTLDPVPADASDKRYVLKRIISKQ